MIAVAAPLTGGGCAVPSAGSPIGNQPRQVPAFYVSETGSDDADGATPESAWATIQKVNVALPETGSTVLFRRGDTFYGELNVPPGCEVAAFGDGPKPILTMYKLLNLASGWVEEAAGVWRIDLGSAKTHLGYTASNDANIGFLLVDGSMQPALKFGLSELATTWDFFCDVPAHALYVRAPANPTTLADDIRAATNGNSYGASGTVIYFQGGQNSVHDVHVTGSGGCGIRGDATDVHVFDCTIDNIGGAVLAGLRDGKVRYGNGIEHWRHASRWTIERNEISHVYDVAWSPQGYDIGESRVVWADMTFRNNYVHDCGQMFEFWSQSDGRSAGFVRVLVEGNVCERAGYGAFSDVRPDQDVRVHLLSYNLESQVDITIQNNVFDNSYGAYSYHLVEPPPGYVTRNNTIRLKQGTKMEYQRPETVEQFAEWQAATGREVGSKVTVL